MGSVPLVIGHRGVPVVAPENTLAGFKKAIEAGADGVELDVHLSKDGELVVIHDELVDRTTDGHGFVRDMTVADLRGLNAAAKFEQDFERQHVPTLAEALDVLGDDWRLLNIEVKSGKIVYPGIEEKLVQFLRERSIVERVIISSFNHYSMVELKRIDSEVRVGLLYSAGLVKPWSYARSIEADALHPNRYTVTPELVKEAHSVGVLINTWTVNSAEDIRRVMNLGVDAVITNDPVLALKIRSEQGAR